MAPKALFLLAICITYGSYSLGSGDENDFELTILHTNDVHSRFLSFNQNVQPCSEKNLRRNQCWGGAARRATAVKKFRRLYKNTVLLDAGDQFQGSIWFTTLKWVPIAAYMNKLNYTAMAVGNHEFDDGDQLLADFASNVNFPMISSNIDASESAQLNGSFVSHVLTTVGGKRIALLGTTAVETPEISGPSKRVKFRDEIDSLKSLIENLKKEYNVDKFVILSHSGIQRDVEMCKLLPDIDIIVGGHTHTFLYEGTPPDVVDEPEGPYPIVVGRNDSSNCLVVQAYANGKYLGLLNVRFDQKGDLKRWAGNPILIDTSFEEDEEMIGILDHFAQNITFAEQKVIARTMVPLGNMHDVCRIGECLIGDILTDSLFNYMKKKLGHRYFSHNNWPIPTEPIFGLAVLNSGGIRQFSVKAGSNITLSNLYSVLPFSNKIVILRLNGSLLYRLFERSIDKFSLLSRHGKFLQVSQGVSVAYDLDCERRDKDNNSFSYHLHNISTLIVPCVFNCRRNETFTVENEQVKMDNKTYLVAMTSFMAGGGDGYSFLDEENLLLPANLGDDLDLDVTLEYLEKIKPIRMTVQNRILMKNGLHCDEHLL